jgi:hypothetical protein
MTDDLLARLREPRVPHYYQETGSPVIQSGYKADPLCAEAADEIERQMTYRMKCDEDIKRKDVEIESLRELLRQVRAERDELAAGHYAALAAERERLCAAIKAADDKASEGDYMLDSDDCISVIRGTWNPRA